MQVNRDRLGMRLMYIVIGVVWITFVSIFVGQIVVFSSLGRHAAAEKYLLSHTNVWEDETGLYTLSFTPSSEYGIFQSNKGDWKLMVDFGIPGQLLFNETFDGDDEYAVIAHWKMDRKKTSITIFFDDDCSSEYKELDDRVIVFYEQKKD